jgi:hypothetical protein
MVYVLKDGDSLVDLLEEIKRKKKKTVREQSLNGSEYQNSVHSEWKKDILAKQYGSLIRGLDGVEYQKSVRSEWD